MLLHRIPTRPALQAFIDSIWIFEADFGLPLEDTRVIAPNGKAKFIYPFRNTLSAIDNGIITDYKEDDIFFIGIWNRPVTLTSTAQVTGTIGIELTPNGLHRFTTLSAFEILNRIYSFSDIFGNPGKRLIQQLTNTPDALSKTEIFQQFLVELVDKTARNNTLIDYAVNLIHTSSGLITIKELERKTGYSKRYIDILFKDHLGISPKTLSAITRFQTFYNSWANSNDKSFYSGNLYDLYYDQAHFIKEFKKFTGHSPRQYATRKNDFGKIFYKK